MLELRDGSIYNLSDSTLLGEGCFLERGEIGCSIKQSAFLVNEGQTKVNTGIVLLNRTTGGLRMLHTVAFYQGKGRSPQDVNASEKVQRDGTCRAIRIEPLF